LADVLAIESCPCISSGVGRVVTGTFTHVRGGILRIRLAGLAEPLGVTSNHSIYSSDRLDFVPAGELRVGETLRNLDGDVRIESIEQLGSEERVYNLEIHGEHVFRVASCGVLVHNSSGADAPKGAGHGFKYDPRVEARAVQDPIAHGFPRLLDDAILSVKGAPVNEGIGYAIRGFHNGKEVVYNMVVKNGVIVHRDFVSAKNWAQRSRSFGFNIDFNKLPTMAP
jgi:hypothetical protein